MALTSPPDANRLNAAYGALRDALGSVGNLQRLLGSRNVAPRAVNVVLPDVAAATQPLLTDMEEFYRLLDGVVAEHVIDELSGYIAEQMRELSAALALAMSKRSMNARSRLTLERSVKSLERKLAGALPLVELLADVATFPRREVDLVELLQLSRSGDQPHTPHAEARRASVKANLPCLILSTHPKAALTLVGLAASCLRETPGDNETFEINLTSDGVRHELRVALGSGGHAFELLVPPRVEVTATCLRGAARGFGLEWQASPEQIWMRWSSGPA